jgi:pSer/pThr/pTyr-binding forkhead associated (FHA) protein
MKPEVRFIVVKGSRATRELRVHSPEIILGRLRGCNIRIPSASVSRRHCRLQLQNSVLLIEDLNSSNGTFLNGVRVFGVLEVNPGDRITVGPVTFEVHYTTATQRSAYNLQPPLLPMGEVIEGELIPELDGEPLSVELLEAFEADSHVETGLLSEDDLLQEDWHIPFDANAQDFLKQFDTGEPD